MICFYLLAFAVGKHAAAWPSHQALLRGALLMSGLATAGEIIPQALCSRFGLQIGAYSAWFVRILLWVVGIISFPISKVLDYLLGSEHGVRSCPGVADGF